MSEDSLIELQNLVDECPYCQTAQTLYLLNLKRLNDEMFHTRLPHTAIHVSNRNRLKQSVEQVETLVSKEASLMHKVASTSSATGMRSLADVEPVETSEFKGKTISELLNLTKPTPVSRPAPKAQNTDDKFLEMLRLEAFAKVHERLSEAQAAMTKTNFLESPERKEATKKIMDNVIATNPKISKIDELSDTKLKKAQHWKLKEEHSLRDDFELVSETLAQLYISQGAHAKAREIYKTLGKIHPEKADQFKKQASSLRQTRSKKS